ncbi:MAG TPA: M48 family metallopeptidase [Candidatus Baltobacteraceae bacterium]|jgi:predicted Zn-dependent protease
MKRILAGLFAVALALSGTVPALAYTQEQQQELQIGQQVYQQLAQKGEIIHSSPYYRTLNSIAARIKSVADKQYFVPFHFILVHEKSPNAFAVPGGNVYVTDSMMTFAQNKEELAGVLCHETSHDINHDVINNMAKDQRLSIYATIASVLLGGRSQLANTAINLAANLQALTYSRDVEHNADHKGAITCAQAGINPWGMVWLFNHFENSPSGGAPPEALSDHPRDDHRISDVETEFKQDPSLFSKFNPDQCSATPIGYAGFRNQYGRGCGTTRRQSSASTHHRTTSSTKCPPGWKFCKRQ